MSLSNQKSGDGEIRLWQGRMICKAYLLVVCPVSAINSAEITKVVFVHVRIIL